MNENAKKSVLIVEDDPLLVKMYEAKFTSEGFTVLKSADGEEGLKVALANHPNFMIVDVMMPRLSGIDMLKVLRADPWGKDVPVVIISNLSEQNEGEKAKLLGVKEYLIKANITPGELVDKVKAYLT